MSYGRYWKHYNNDHKNRIFSPFPLFKDYDAYGIGYILVLIACPCPPYNNTHHQVGATPLSSLFATVLPDHHQVHKRGGLDHHLDHLHHLGHHLDHHFDHCKVHKRYSLPLDHDCCPLDVDEVNPNLTGGRFQLPGRCSEKTRLHFSHSRCSSLSVSRTT